MKINRFLCVVAVGLCYTCLSLTLYAGGVNAKLGKWHILYDETQQRFSLKNGKDLVIGNFSAEATCEREGDEAILLETCKMNFTGCTRGNDEVAFCFSRDGFSLREVFCLQGEDLLAQLTLAAQDTLHSRYLAPIAVRSPYALLPHDGVNKMLKVPFDNDDFVRYHHFNFGSQMLSFEAAAFYEGVSRKGVVLGSIDHDHWKSGIRAATSQGGTMDTLLVYSGVSDKESRDMLPHGCLVGREIASARFFIGCYDDWRKGMEQFARANLRVVPRRETWKDGTPMGWQSWGVMATKNSFQCDTAVSNYFHKVLQPAGFCNEQGKIVMSIDSWDNLSAEQKRELCLHCEARNQIPGTYWTPFCLWWDEKRLHRQKLPGQDIYLAYDCTLKANGKPIKYDGAYCLDPTHPGVKAWITAEISKIKQYGFRYLKVDFTDNAIIQADAYYNPEVHTAVEAYNEGFSHFRQEVDKGEPLFVALSIAPVFPYQYGNSRRIACDTWGRISHTEYSMNALGGGWWHSLLYQYSDPDHCPLIGSGNDAFTSVGENRARLSNLCAAGMLLISDNYDTEDRTGRGNPQISIERAPLVLMNSEVNALGRLGRTFRPVYGYDVKNEKENAQADSFFQLDLDDCTYVIVINYSDTHMEGILPAKDLGKKKVGRIHELWLNSNIAPAGKGLPYSVPAYDARIYKFR